jgi:hypothetical protein
MTFASPIWSYLAGITLSNDGTTPNTTIDTTAGFATDSTNSFGIIPPAFKKTTALFAAGTGNGGLPTGVTLTASTWYHYFAAIVGGAPDFFFDTSAVAAHAPAGTTAFRRVGSVKTDASSHLIPFTQDGDEFLWKTPTYDVQGVTPSSATQSLETVNSPLGIQTLSFGIFGVGYVSASDSVVAYSPDMGAQGGIAYLATNEAAMFVSTTARYNSTYAYVRTNTSSQIAMASSVANATAYWVSLGWIDTRGRDN